MIPQDKAAPVLRALREAFGTDATDELHRLPNGLSSDLAFRIVVNGEPYALRIMTRIDERNDPARIFACMQTAAEADLAPRVLYANVPDGVAITDFIDAVPLPPSDALVLLPRALRKLHALTPFPKAFNYVTAHKFFIWKFRAGGLLPAPEIEDVFRRYDQLCAVYPRLDADLVSCHMDLKPEHILFDGRRVWLADWTAAFVNDRYFDLAVAANFLVDSLPHENTYLEEYFGRPPEPYERARFFVMRQVLHLLTATVFVSLGAAGQPIRRDENQPSFRDFHERIRAGEIDLADNRSKIAYGLVHWDQLLANVRHPRFDEALAIVSAANPPDGARLLPSAAP